MGGNVLASQIMDVKGKVASPRNVAGKWVVSEFQAVFLN
jgi:hypothetical protein